MAKSSTEKEEVFEEDVLGEGIHMGMTVITEAEVRKLHLRGNERLQRMKK